MKKLVSSEYLRSVLAYDESTGDFRWKDQLPNVKSLVAGHLTKKTGYRVIGLDGRLYLAHRLAWLYMHGEFPDKAIDHIDRNRDNNAKANLRLATPSENAANTGLRATNKSGFKGVSWCATTEKWRATITYNGKQKSLGRHLCRESAMAAYQTEALRLHPAYAATDLGVRFTDLEAH